MALEIKITSQEEIETAFILTRELVEYHDALDVFTITQQRFGELIGSGALLSYMAYVDVEAAGILNMFYKYTTFSGRKILYIEDLYVRKNYRGHGIGGKLLEKAKEIAIQNECEQIELKCAVWNICSAEFYKSHGMKQDNYWKTYTLNESSF